MRHSRLPRSGVCETEVALILESRSPSLALVMLSNHLPSVQVLFEHLEL